MWTAANISGKHNTEERIPNMTLFLELGYSLSLFISELVFLFH